ncbi:ABC transporter permease [Leifsonia sp. Leaf264]|uniref:ABC transporter permease n=1 Tax=Leifsonia sp. Leaf264 TaxID=1736314 RepID=UPI0006FDA23E|nr:ABC transporter permease [Leifsonia sp. Leaf264]KQO98840.1 hypothetical protein ASF30_12315 [Leifsonia sp. Leaf264]
MNTPTRRTRLATLIGAFIALSIVFAPTAANAAVISHQSEITQSVASAQVELASTSVQASAALGDPSPSVKPSGSDDPKTSEWIGLNRWSDITSKLYVREPDDIFKSAGLNVQKSMKEMCLSGLSLLWGLTGMLSDFAADMQPIDALGEKIDEGTKKLKNAVWSQPLIFVAVAIALLGAIFWNQARGRDSSRLWKRMLGVVGTVAFIGMLGTGATASHGTGAGFTPGTGSPAWLLKTTTGFLDDGMNAALSSLNAINFSDPSTGTAEVEGKLGGQLSCDRYEANIAAAQQSAFKSNGSSATLESISSLWQTTALETWKSVQFGAGNPYANKVWCHRADQLIGVSTTTQFNLTTDGVPGIASSAEAGNNTGDKSRAWHQYNNADEAKSMIAWAACNWDGDSWYIEDAFKYRFGDTSKPWMDAQYCKTWWQHDTQVSGNGMDGADGEDDYWSGFRIGVGEGGSAEINEYSNDPEVTNFVNSVNSGDGFASLGLILMSYLSTIVVTLILGVALSGIIMFAKIMAVLTVMTMMITLIASMFSREGPGAKLASMLKQVVGFTVLASASTLIFVLVTWMTQSMIDMGLVLAAPGTLISIVWVGMAPIFAMVGLHMLFKNVLKKPSPMTPAGMMAWGGGAAAAGGALVNSVQNRTWNKATGKARDTLGLNRNKGGVDENGNPLATGRGITSGPGGNGASGAAGNRSGSGDLPRTKAETKALEKKNKDEANAAKKERKLFDQTGDTTAMEARIREELFGKDDTAAAAAAAAAAGAAAGTAAANDAGPTNPSAAADMAAASTEFGRDSTIDGSFAPEAPDEKEAKPFDDLLHDGDSAASVLTAPQEAATPEGREKLRDPKWNWKDQAGEDLRDLAKHPVKFSKQALGSVTKEAAKGTGWALKHGLPATAAVIAGPVGIAAYSAVKLHKKVSDKMTLADSAKADTYATQETEIRERLLKAKEVSDKVQGQTEYEKHVAKAATQRTNPGGAPAAPAPGAAVPGAAPQQAPQQAPAPAGPTLQPVFAQQRAASTNLADAQAFDQWKTKNQQ